MLSGELAEWLFSVMCSDSSNKSVTTCDGSNSHRLGAIIGPKGWPPIKCM